MQLDTSRFFSDRLIFDEASECKFRITNGFWDWVQRIISWIYTPAQYSEENRRTVECFQRYLVDTLGADRLKRISQRYDLNWEKMKENPLLSRDVAKILIGTKCVTVEDVNEKVGNFLEVDAERLSEVVEELSTPFNRIWEVAEITDRITGRPTQFLSRFFFDPLLADRERLRLVKEHPDDTFDHFMHNMLARVIKREPQIGALIPAPNHPDGRAQFYYVSAKLITGKGMVSYILHPATKDTDLEPIRLFRGTSPRNSEVDALSTIITDLEKNLGMKAYQSGRIFESIIAEKLGSPTIEGGHSMGSTIVQYRLANLDHIRKAYLYSGPGISVEEVQKFNQKNRQVHLVIRAAANDALHRLGEAHLGYNAPANVHVDYVRYRPIHKHDHDPHVSIFAKEPEFFVQEELSPETFAEHFFNKNNVKEYYRALIGPIVVPILEHLKEIVRFFFNSRIDCEHGLKIGRMDGTRWQVDHFRVV